MVETAVSATAKGHQKRKNIAFLRRCAENRLGQKECIKVSPWVANLSKDKLESLLASVYRLAGYDEKTDPTGTKAAGVIRFEGHYVLWRIKEFDATPPGMLLLETPVHLGLFIVHSSEF